MEVGRLMERLGISGAFYDLCVFYRATWEGFVDGFLFVGRAMLW